MIKEVHPIHRLDQAKVLLNPVRVSILELLRDPHTSAELSEKLKMSQQRINNHLKELLDSGLIRKIETRAKRNLIEAVYQAVSKFYWISPKLTRDKFKEIQKMHEKVSLHNLILLSEKLQEDAAHLLSKSQAQEVPSVGLTAEIFLRNEEERETFAREFLAALHEVIEKYQRPSGKEQQFTAMVVCYPSVTIKEN